MKVFIFTLMLFSGLTYAQLDLVTLDNWNIYSTSKNRLVLSKGGESNEVNFIGFHMDRPFCVCANPILNLQASGELPKEGEIISAQMSVDMRKSKEIKLKVLNVWDKERKLVILKPLHFLPFRESQIIKIKFPQNNSLFSEEIFITKGIIHAMKSSKSVCDGNYYYEEPEEKETSFEQQV